MGKKIILSLLAAVVLCAGGCDTPEYRKFQVEVYIRMAYNEGYMNGMAKTNKTSKDYIKEVFNEN